MHESASFVRKGLREYWLRAPTPSSQLAARPGSETFYARIVEPADGSARETLISGSGLCLEFELLALDEDLAEGLALAHDLGHPPFGHAGERALDRCLAAGGGFDHNAQTLRVVTELERRYPDFDGLNLAWETLEGLVKHNGPLTLRDGSPTGPHRERGLPHAIRSDNGVPFASPNALFNLSKLAVWWLRLGIDIERIKPGRPQQNGRHERMHLTLKREATRPPGMNCLQRQACFDAFVSEFNTERARGARHEVPGRTLPDFNTSL